MIRRAAPLAAWLALLAAAVLALHRLGSAPTWSAPSGASLSERLELRGPAVAAFALLRVVALGVGWYLLVATTAALVLRVLRADRAAGTVERCAPAAVGRIVRAALGVSLAASSFTVTAAAAADEGAPATPTMRRLPDVEPATSTTQPATSTPTTQPADSSPTMHRLPDAPPSTSTTQPADSSPTMHRLPDAPPSRSTTQPADSSPTMHRLPDARPVTSTVPPASTTTSAAPPPTTRRLPDAPPPPTSTTQPAEPTTVTAAPPPPPATTTTIGSAHAAPATAAPPPTMRRLPEDAPTDAAPAATTWVVRPGDHLWAIAERTLAEAWQRAPSDHEIDPFWRALVERNRPQLRDPANPDLLFPGDPIEVPAPPRR